MWKYNEQLLLPLHYYSINKALKNNPMSLANFRLYMLDYFYKHYLHKVPSRILMNVL